jgi:hypothetical protein
MRALKITVWCLLVLGALSAIQTDAFARGRERPAYHPPVTTDQKDQPKAEQCSGSGWDPSKGC